MKLHFVYVYNGRAGNVYAPTVAKALDQIKVQQLGAQGVNPTHPQFRLMKSKLDAPWRINLAFAEDQKFRSLYRAKVEDFVTAEQELYLAAYRKALKDISAICPTHLRPSGTQTL